MTVQNKQMHYLCKAWTYKK